LSQRKRKQLYCLCRNVFGNQEVDYWEMAVCEGQNIKDLKDEEIFGYPVESGMGCFMDLETQNL
jgi:hypothetical protein